MARNKYPEETVQKILAVSYRLFLEKGYDHTTIQDITDALGMSKGAVYHHFKSKEAILDRIYDQYYAESGLHAAALDAPGLSGLEKLRKLLLLELTDQGKLSIDSVTLSFRSNPQLLQLPGIVQAVLRVPGKTADGFCDDEVNLPGFTVTNHSIEVFSALRGSAGDTFICVDASQLILRIAVDVFRVVSDLIFKAVQLLVLLRGYPAVCRHPDELPNRGSPVSQFLPCRDVYDFSCHINSSFLQK